MYPASHYVTSRERLTIAIEGIRQELGTRLAEWFPELEASPITEADRATLLGELASLELSDADRATVAEIGASVALGHRQAQVREYESRYIVKFELVDTAGKPVRGTLLRVVDDSGRDVAQRERHDRRDPPARGGRRGTSSPHPGHSHRNR